MDIKEAQRIVAERFELGVECETSKFKQVSGVDVCHCNVIAENHSYHYDCPDLTIYENLAPVLDKLRFTGARWRVNGWGMVGIFKNEYLLEKQIAKDKDLPTTLLTMIAEMIDKGEV